MTTLFKQGMRTRVVANPKTEKLSSSLKLLVIRSSSMSEVIMKVYMLLMELPSGKKILATDGKDKLVVSSEENSHLLEWMGARMLRDEIIKGYQLLVTAGPPMYQAPAV